MLALSIRWLLVPLLLALAFVEWAAGTDTVRHSGMLAAVDLGKGTIVVDEVGPWRVKDGITQVTRRTFVVPPTTEVTVARRAEDVGGSR
jgi:hypothetical protein